MFTLAFWLLLLGIYLLVAAAIFWKLIILIFSLLAFGGSWFLYRSMFEGLDDQS